MRKSCWCRIGIEFRHIVFERSYGRDGEGMAKKTSIFEFRAKNPNGDKKIDDFLDATIAWYLEKVEMTQDDGRYERK